MKNLKKIAALVIVLAMALSTVSFAAFTDVAADASYNEAVTVMSALGLLKGYEDGSFGPDKTITRAEFAAVVVRMLGMEDAAAGAATATNFTDVPASHWAAGYVKIANQKEIILGYGDGTFGPDDEVTYEQAIKMLVCALGYAPMFADVKDAYPTSYMAQANTLGMTVGANGKIGDKATRAIVARLAYNALDDKLMEQTGFGSDKNFEQVNKTLLSDYLKVAKVDTVVTPVGFGAEDATKVTLATAGLGSEYDMFYQAIPGTNPVQYGNIIPGNDYDCVEGLSIPKGYAVTAFVDYNEDDMVVLAVVPKAGKNETLVITATQMKDGAITLGTPTQGQTKAVNGKLTYYATSSEETSKTEEVKIDGDLIVYKNENIKPDALSNGAYAGLANYANGTIPTITLINNDNDAAYDVLIYKDMQSDIVEDIYDVTERISTKINSYNYKFDKELDNQTYTLKNTEGKELSFADIKVGDIINVFISSEDHTNNNADKYYEYIISSDKVEGSVSETNANTNEAYINGVAYKNAAGVTAGDKGIFYVDILGNIIDKELDASSRTFGLLYAIYEDTNGADTEVKATIYTKDGKFENFTFAKNVEFVTSGTSNTKKSVAKSDLSYDKNNTQLKENGNTLINMANAQLVMYSANSAGEINTIVDANNIYAQSGNDYSYVSMKSNEKYEADDASIDDMFVVDSTVIIANKDASTLLNVNAKDNYSVSSKAIFADDEPYTIEYIYDYNTDEIAYMVVYNAQATVEPTSPVMYVSADPSTAETEDGDPYYIIRGYVNGELKTVSVDADTRVYTAEENQAGTAPKADATYTAGAIAKGAVIQYTEGDIAAAVRVIASATDIETIADYLNNGQFLTYGDDAKDDDEGYLTSGKVDKYSNGMVYYNASAATANDKIKVKAGVAAARVTLTNGSVDRVYHADSVANAETDTNATVDENDDIVIVYNFDGDTMAVVIIDGKKDTI